MILDETLYTAATWADLEIALTAAIAVKNNRFATTPIIEGATAALEDATDALAYDQVATPVAAPVAGAVLNPTEVALTCATEGATIYYTTNGDAPTAASTEYTAAIEVTVPVTIKAIAIKTGMTNSDVLTAAYTIAT